VLSNNPCCFAGSPRAVGIRAGDHCRLLAETSISCCGLEA
jgi:hypothetical protein